MDGDLNPEASRCVCGADVFVVDGIDPETQQPARIPVEPEAYPVLVPDMNGRGRLIAGFICHWLTCPSTSKLKLSGCCGIK